jgi:hypothetical protein
MDEKASARDVVVGLMDGYLSTQLLYLAARLGLADLLAAGPRSSAELAALTGTDASTLHRVLRGLVIDGVLDEDEEGRFVLTDAGRYLESSRADSMRGAILARGELYYRAAGSLLETLERGGTAFRHAHGVDFFDAIAANGASGAAFQASMTSRSQREAAAVVAAYDFSSFGHVIDVGGGRGVLLSSILRANPHLRGTLLDRPDVVAGVGSDLEAAGLSGRFGLAAGDFFAHVPDTGDLYLLSRVLHDWDDGAAVSILTCCRKAMSKGCPLVLVEAVLPDRARERPGVIRMDLHMLVLLGGRERTIVEFERLFAASGFRLRRTIGLAGQDGIHLLEAEAS